MILQKSFRPSKRIVGRPTLPYARLFRTGQNLMSEQVNHYEILGLEANASSGDIKKQFYSLSKAHHPDHNPDDPKASERFMKVSEAYSILGNPHNREKYDQGLQKSRTTYTQNRRGSYSSSASPYGARPASGLSKRRGHFRGPPPSFYRSGGWGVHSEKRKAQADATARAHAAFAAASKVGGMGHGQGQAGFDNDVPHFDQRAHLRTHQQQEERRKQRMGPDSMTFENGRGLVMGTVFLSCVMAIVCVPFALIQTPDPASSQKMKKVQK